MAVHRHFPRNTITLSQTFEGWIFVGSIVLAWWLLQSDWLAVLIAHIRDFGPIGTFFEGFFFTSMFTAAPAIVAIFESAHVVPAWEFAVIGGFGAVCGDLLIFRFVRSAFIERLLCAVLSPGVRRFGRGLVRGPFFWLGPLAGVIVIASPLPDELGLIMMGLSHINLPRFILLAFLANAAGIYVMVLFAQRVL